MKKHHKRMIMRAPRVYEIWGKCAKDSKYLELDDLPRREKMRPPGSWRGLGDDFAPLYRFLFSRCGKKWDDVYSEICEVNDERSLDGWHFRVHVRDLVEFFGEPPSISRRGRAFYIDDDALLQHRGYDRRKYRKEPIYEGGVYFNQTAKRNEMVFEGILYFQEKGIWYQRLEQKVRRYNDDWRTFGEFEYDKRQLNKKQLRGLGLKNN